jgi:hypothetical protein
MNRIVALGGFPSISNVAVMYYGEMIFYTTAGARDMSLSGYGGALTPKATTEIFWVPGRVYNDSGSIGEWPLNNSNIVVGTIFEGRFWLRNDL